MTTNEFRNTIGPLLPENLRLTVLAELEERDRQIARLVLDHDANLEALRSSAVSLGEMQSRVDRLTSMGGAISRLVAALCDLKVPERVGPN